VRRQRPHHAGAKVGHPRHAAERTLFRIHQLTRGPVAAAGLAQPARATTTELAGPARRTVVVGPDHAEGGDRAAGTRAQRAANAPHLIELVASADLDLVAVVVERGAEALVHGRMVVVLHQAGVVVAGIRVHRAFDVALGLGPQVADVQRPLVVPGAVELELHRLVGALGPLVTHDQAAAERLVAVLGAVERHPVLGVRAPQRVLLAGV